MLYRGGHSLESVYCRDNIYGGKLMRIERQIHHYGSGLNALPLISHFESNPTDFYLLRVGFGGTRKLSFTTNNLIKREKRSVRPVEQYRPRWLCVRVVPFFRRHAQVGWLLWRLRAELRRTRSKLWDVPHRTPGLWMASVRWNCHKCEGIQGHIRSSSRIC